MDEPQVVLEQVESMIHVVRGLRVILDEDIAALYEVDTRSLVRAMRSNQERFPDDFVFRLTSSELAELRTREGGNRGRGGRRNLPMAFTEHGVAMLSGVLRSERAVHVNVEVVRAFIRMRNMMTAQHELSLRLDELENRYDSQFGVVFDAIRQLMLPPAPPRNPIGFGPPDDSSV
ncbi:MAG: ORF6N domain-containing protein [Coriobacteriia bacterium]